MRGMRAPAGSTVGLPIVHNGRGAVLYTGCIHHNTQIH
jgi:hypothetical protein